MIALATCGARGITAAWRSSSCLNGLLLISACAALLAWSGCTAPVDRAQPTDWESGVGFRSRSLNVVGGGPGFTDIEPALPFQNLLSDAAIVQNRHRMNGSGVAVGDVNADGLADIFFPAMESPAALFLNRGDWEFEDFTVAAGLGRVTRWSTGAVFADVDGDGDLDLFVTAQTSANALYLNDGTGVFAESEAGLGSLRGSMTAALADTDGDGDLDLYVSNYKRIALRDSLSPDRLLFDNVTGSDGTVIPELVDHVRIRQSGGRQMRLELGEEDQYYLNDGRGQFRIAPIAGLDKDWGMTARLQDVSGDGIPDLYVANDFESPDYFLLGDGTGGWVDRAQVLAHTSNSSMSVDMSDVNRDGAVDLFTPDMLSDDPVRRRFEVGTAAPMSQREHAVPQYMQNTLQLGRPDGSFSEVAWQYGIAASGWSWSGIFLDVDLDGWEDLLISTGHSFDVQDADAQVREREAIRRVRSVLAFRALITEYPRLPLKNRAFRNKDGLRFEVVENAWGLGREADITHGMALGDFDGDGDLDVVANRLNQEAGLFRNESAAPRVAVRLTGASGNTHGIGARVTLSGGVVTQTQEMVAGGLYLSGSESVLSFGALADTMRIVVDWRSGAQQVIESVRPNRLYEISEADSDTDPGGAPAVAGQARAAASPRSASLLSSGWTAGTLGAPVDTTLAREFDGAQLRPLLPQRLGPEAPALAVGDLTQDGSEYVVIGASAGGQPMVFRVEGGRPRRIAGMAIQPATGTWAGMAMSQGLLFVAVSSYGTSQQESHLVSFRLDSTGLTEVQRVPLGPGSPSQVALGDVDGDGAEDVFVGMRVLAGRYPESTPSLLLTRRGERLEVAATLELGMVTGAAFGDADLDGDVDLAVSTDWGTIRLLENVGGDLMDRSEAWGFSGKPGLWRGIAWGDLNGDGKPDLAASNWGWNSRLGRIGASEPGRHSLRLYYSDYDSDGVPDPIIAEYRDDLQGWSPLMSLVDLRAALPQLNRRISSFHTYASFTMQDLLGKEAPFLELTTLASTAWINAGQSFTAVALPPHVQRSPGTGVLIGDLSGDGQDEVMMAQNVFSVLPEKTMRQDAGLGAVVTLREGTWSSRDIGIWAPQEWLAVWSGGLILTTQPGPAYVLTQPAVRPAH